uniref:GP-PDE domain-containing protein n=1 Tax=Romanomermis culicivorax TaxID=13658 RepID=A0A915JYB3_ROMCU
MNSTDNCDDGHEGNSAEDDETNLLDQNEDHIAVVGDILELGSWNVDHAVRMQPKKSIISKLMDNVRRNDDKENTTYTVTVNLSQNPSPKVINYRYITFRQLRNANYETMSVLSRWETQQPARKIVVSPRMNLDDRFGYVNPTDHQPRLSEGWLTKQTEIRLVIQNRAAIVSKLPSLDSENLKIRVLPIDIRRSLNPIYASPHSTGSLAADRSHTDMLYAVLTPQCRSSFKPQPTEGHLFKKDDYLIFKSQTLVPDFTAFLIEFHELPTETPIAYSIFMPHGRENSSAYIKLDILTLNNSIVGHLTANYLVIRPIQYEHISLNASETFIKYWSATHTLDVGHRGLGRSFARKALARENTIKSLNMAANFKLDYVEFDVHLSKDLTPVIYHDFSFYANLEPISKPEPSDRSTYFDMPIKDLTVKQLHSLQYYHLDGYKPLSFANDTIDEMPFPLLKDVFQKVDISVGFNIEIKYPMLLFNQKWECETYYDPNLYIDKILATVYKYAGNRRIVFSSFVPDICILLKMKQNRYPVALLSQGKTARYDAYLDRVCNSGLLGVDFAICNDLLGVSMHSEDLLNDPAPGNVCNERKLVWFIWGNDLVEEAVRQKFRTMKCSGLIRDDVISKET